MTNGRYAVLTAVLTLGVVVVSLMFFRAPANARTQALQRTFNDKDAAALVGQLDKQAALKLLALDTWAFIPLYSTWLAVMCFWAASSFAPGTRGHVVFTLLAYAGWVAGILDLVENAGIRAEIAGNSSVAFMTASVATLKWVLIALTFWPAVIRGASFLLGRR